MKLIVVLVLFISPIPWPQSSTEKLPKAARDKLDRRLPGWKFIEPRSDVQQFFIGYMPAGASPVMIRGDFDGNHKTDYAALVETKSGRYVAVFLRQHTGYKLHVIEEPMCDYLSLAKKGTQDYNFDEQRKIIYPNDAIVAVIFEKAGTSYVFKNGRFRSFVSID